MNHAIYAPDHVRRLVLLGLVGLSPWRANLVVLVPFARYAMRPTDATFERIIFRALGEGARVDREFRPWMLIMGKSKPKTAQPFHISSRKLRLTTAPTLVIRGGKGPISGDHDHLRWQHFFRLRLERSRLRRAIGPPQRRLGQRVTVRVVETEPPL